MLSASRGPFLSTARCYQCWCLAASRPVPDELTISTPGPLGMAVLSFPLSKFYYSNYAPHYSSTQGKYTAPSQFVCAQGSRRSSCCRMALRGVYVPFQPFSLVSFKFLTDLTTVLLGDNRSCMLDVSHQ